MLPSLNRNNPRTKEQHSVDLPTLMQAKMMEKAEAISNGILNNLVRLNQSVSQNFGSFEEISKTVRSESSNIATMVGKIVKLQSYAVRAEKDTLSEIKEMNRNRARSDVQEELPRRLEEKGSAPETPPAKPSVSKQSFSALYQISVRKKRRIVQEFQADKNTPLTISQRTFRWKRNLYLRRKTSLWSRSRNIRTHSV